MDDTFGAEKIKIYADDEAFLTVSDNINEVEQEKDIPGNNALLRKLDKTLSDPLHHRLLSAYASTNANSAKEAMEHELARILLEVLDRVD